MVRDHLINKMKISQNNISIHYCSFNAVDHQQIIKGAKSLLPLNSAMTGREFCSLVGLDFDKIVEARKKDQAENLNYFISELKRIPEIISKL
jgi:hypothetical protein